MLKSLAKVALLFASIPCVAQVQLGGHVYVPSSSDSVGGLQLVTFTSNADCTIATQTNCTVAYESGAPNDHSSAYVGTYVVETNLPLTSDRAVVINSSPGRVVNVENFTSSELLLAVGTNSGFILPSKFSAIVFDDGFGDTVGVCADQSSPTSFLMSGFFGCSISPYDIGQVNPGIITSNMGMVWKYNIDIFGGNNIISYVGFDSPVTPDGQQTVFLAANIHGVNDTDFSGTLYNPNVGSAAIGFYTPDSGGQHGCVSAFGSELGVSTMTDIADFCNDGVTFNVPIARPPSSVTPTCNTHGCYRYELDGSITEWGSISVPLNGSTYNTATITLPFAAPHSVVFNQPSLIGMFLTDSTTPPCIAYSSTSLTGASVYMARCIVASAGGGLFDVNTTLNWSAIAQ